MLFWLLLMLLSLLLLILLVFFLDRLVLLKTSLKEVESWCGMAKDPGVFQFLEHDDYSSDDENKKTGAFWYCNEPEKIE